MNSRDNIELRRLIDKQLDHPPLDKQEVTRLESLLQNEAHMECYLQSMDLAAHMPDAAEHAELADLVNRSKPNLATRHWIPAAAAAACVVFTAGWFAATHSDPSIVETATPTTLKTPPISNHQTASQTAHLTSNHAQITGMFGVRWTDPAENASNDIQTPKKVVIESGLIELTYLTGSAVIIEGPAHYTINGANNGTLKYGKFVASVPKGAEGFTVDYPMGKVLDLGTEFGVNLSQTGEFSVGVFKGEVELHPQGGDHITLIEENHALSQSPNTPGVLHSIPFDRKSFIRQVPSREFAWLIDSGEVIEKEFDVSHLIWKPGNYRAVVKWMYGKNAAHLHSASLWLNGKRFSEDTHAGWTGIMSQTQHNIYNLKIHPADYQKGVWTLKVKLSAAQLQNQAAQSINSQGIILLEEGLAFRATASDFIGRWQYTHDGSTWEREILKGGKINLYANGVLRPGFKKSYWFVEDGVMKVLTPHRNAFEDHLLRDTKTMIFVDKPYRNAVKIEDEK